MWRLGHRSRLGVVYAAAGLALLLLPVALPLADASNVGVTPAPSVLTAPTVAPYAATGFAERAGYVPGRSAAVADVAPAQGSNLVVVTFAPRDPSFFAAPPAGALPLSTAGVADRYGLTETEYTAAIAYFMAEGLRVVHTWSDRLSVSLEGPIPAIDRAFGTTVLEGWEGGQRVTFEAVPPSLPSALESEVASVVGLSTGFDSFTFPALTGPAAVPAGATPAQGSGDLVTPAIARSIYDLSSLYNLTSSPTYASSEGIALLLWGDGYNPNDISTFFQQDYPSTFPSVAVVPEPVDGAPSPSSSAVSDPCRAAQELTLDLEWSGSMAPGATLYAVYAPESTPPTCSPSSASMADALHTAVGLPVSAISMSFGTPESSDASLVAAWDTYLAEGVQEGITFLAATGDSGGDASSNCSGGPAPEYPASSPDVLAVGGTDVSLTRNLFGTITGFSESAWNDSGGGFSTQFAAPAWQTATGSSNRGMPDVSATAAENFVYFNSAAMVAGGTSFATPLWAGLITEMDAMHGSSFGLIAPRLYSIGSAEPSGKVAVGLADITSGSTCIGTASPGWDPETGWGSPRAFLLYEDLTATFVSLSLAVSPDTVGPGATVTISAHLANRTTAAPIAGVPVIVSLTSSTDLGPCTGTFGSADPTTDSQGNISLSVSVPACYLGSHAEAQVEVISDGYYGTNSTTIAVNLLGYLPFLGPISVYPYNLLGFALILGAATAIGYVLGRPRQRPVEPTAVAPPALIPPPSTPPPAAPFEAGGQPSPANDAPSPPPDVPPAEASGPTPQKP
jgi:kumamolisin